MFFPLQNLFFTQVTQRKNILIKCDVTSLLSSVLSVCEYKKNTIVTPVQSSCPLPRVLPRKVPGANIRHLCRFVTSTQTLLLWWFFSLSKAGVWGLRLPGVHLRPPDLHHLWVPGGAPPPLRNRPAALRRLADAPPLRRRLAGGAPPLSAFLPRFLLLAFVVGRAGAFPFLLVCGGAVAQLLLLRWRWAGVIPRADLHHQGGGLQEASCGLGVVWVEPLWFPISRRDAFLTPDPVWGDGIWISSQHGLLIEFPGTDVWFKRERWPGWPSFPYFPAFLPFSAFIFGAPSVGRRLPWFLPLLGPTAFADSRAAAASPACGGFSRSNGNVFLGLCLSGSLSFFHLPGTNLRHVVEVPAGLGANGWLAATDLLKSSNKISTQWVNCCINQMIRELNRAVNYLHYEKSVY